MALLFLLCAFLFSCSGGNAQVSNKYEYQIPEQLDDGWKVSSLSEVGMDEEIITKMMNKIISGKFKGIHSMLIVKDGALVHEAYFQGHHRESLHKMHSVTKSLSSTLIGIAIDNGLIEGTDEPVSSFFPQYAEDFQDRMTREITLKHILTMTSGFDWDEMSYSYGDQRNSECQQVQTDDWVKFVLERPMKDRPGTHWVYNTGSVHLLSAVLKKASDKFAH
jgi:CubicO group peptidase (beta-lactamase class C family)